MRWVAVVLLLAGGLFGCNQGFGDEDIAALKKTVKAEFEKRPGVTVSEVTFMKESAKKLMGLVKLKAGELEVTKSCSATLGEGRQYIWKCE